MGAEEQVNLLGLGINPLTMSQTVVRCEQLISTRNAQHVVVNAAKAVSANESTRLKDIINSCDLVSADGMSIVWASRLLGKPIPERVAGIDLMYELVGLSKMRGYTIYLLGASEDVSAQVCSNFEEKGAKIVGRRNGYWDKSEELAVVQTIASLEPDILFIAIPSPEKEFFLHEQLSKLNCGLAVGVGGSFDVVAGKTQRAPKYLQNLGLEWVYRLMQEPKRMFKRYAVGNSKFLLLVCLALVRSWNRR